MALLDELTEFADDLAFAGGTGRQLMGDVIDLTQARDIGNGENIYLGIAIGGTAVTSGGAATVQFEFVSDAQEAIAVDGSATVHLLTPEFTVAQLTAETVMFWSPLPIETVATYERYVGLLANVGTAALTAGTLNAFLTGNPYGWKAYADAVN